MRIAVPKCAPNGDGRVHYVAFHGRSIKALQQMMDSFQRSKGRPAAQVDELLTWFFSRKAMKGAKKASESKMKAKQENERDKVNRKIKRQHKK